MAFIRALLLLLAACLLARGHADRSLQSSTATLPVQLALSDVPVDYALSAPLREAIANIVKDVLQTSLDPMVSVSDVTLAGYLPCRSGGLAGTSFQAYQQWEAGHKAWAGCAIESSQWGAQTSLPANTVNAAVWNGGACPMEYLTGRSYAAGELSSVCTTKVGNALRVNNCGCTVYQCKNDIGVSRWCGLPGYEPGNSQHWTMAWELVGSCAKSATATNPVSHRGVGCIVDGSDGVSVPLRIAVEAPVDIADSALSYVVQALMDNAQSLSDAIRPQAEALMMAILVVGPYDPTFVKESTAGPTPNPTRPPTQPEEKEILREVPLQINLDGVGEYAPTREDQEAILDIVEGVIRENVRAPLGVVDVSYADDNGGNVLREERNARPEGRRLRNSLYLPVDVTVKGPADVINTALPSLLEIAEGNNEEIAARLKDYDFAAFKDVEVGYEARDMVDVASDTVITNHPVQFYFKNVVVGYELSARDRESFVGYLTVLMEDDLGYDWDLIQVAHASRFEREASTPHLPVRITVRGPVDSSARDARSYVLRVLRGRKRDMEHHLQSLDRGAFREVVLSVDSKDLPDVTAPTFVEDPVRVTEHRVQLSLEGMPRGYKMGAEARASIVRFFEEAVRDTLPALDDALRLVDVEYAGEMGYETTPPSMPLIVNVKGPSRSSAKTPAYLAKILEDNEQRFETFLASLDSAAFEDASVSMGAYDEDFVSDSVPGIQGLQETVHSVRIDLQNAPSGYQLADRQRSSITRFVRELLEDNLRGAFELVDVAYTSSSNGHALPLRITVRGPPDADAYFVLDVLNTYGRDIEAHIRSLDRDQLGDVFVSVEMHNGSPSAPSPSSGYQPTSYVYQPTSSSSMGDQEETLHPIMLKIDGIRSNYQLSDSDRASIIRFLRGKIEDTLGDPLKLVDVMYAGRLVSGGGRYLRSEPISLPLLVRLKGPSYMADYALTNLLEAIRDSIWDLELFLSTIDGNTFRHARVSVDTYGLERVSNETLDEAVQDKLSGVEIFLITMTTLFFLCCFGICCAGGAYKYKAFKESQITAKKLEEEKLVKKVVKKSALKPSSVRKMAPYEPKVKWAPVPSTTALIPYNPLQIEANNRAPLQIQGQPAGLPRLMTSVNQTAPDDASTASSSSDSSASTEPYSCRPVDSDDESSAIIVTSETTSMRSLASMSAITIGEDPPSEHEAPQHQEPLKIANDEISSVQPPRQPQEDDDWSDVSSVVAEEVYERQAHSFHHGVRNSDSTPSDVAARKTQSFHPEWNTNQSDDDASQPAPIQSGTSDSSSVSDSDSVTSTEALFPDNPLDEVKEERQQFSRSRQAGVQSDLKLDVGSVSTGASSSKRRRSSTSTKTMHLEDLPQEIQDILGMDDVRDLSPESTRTLDLDDFPDAVQKILSMHGSVHGSSRNDSYPPARKPTVTTAASSSVSRSQATQLNASITTDQDYLEAAHSVASPASTLSSGSSKKKKKKKKKKGATKAKRAPTPMPMRKSCPTNDTDQAYDDDQMYYGVSKSFTHTTQL